MGYWIHITKNYKDFFFALPIYIHPIMAMTVHNCLILVQAALNAHNTRGTKQKRASM
jgi:hypothetical protein